MKRGLRFGFENVVTKVQNSCGWYISISTSVVTDMDAYNTKKIMVAWQLLIVCLYSIIFRSSRELVYFHQGSRLASFCQVRIALRIHVLSSSSVWIELILIDSNIGYILCLASGVFLCIQFEFLHINPTSTTHFTFLWHFKLENSWHSSNDHDCHLPRLTYYSISMVPSQYPQMDLHGNWHKSVYWH